MRDRDRDEPVVVGARLAHLERDEEPRVVHERFLRKFHAPPTRKCAVRPRGLELERDAIREAGDERA